MYQPRVRGNVRPVNSQRGGRRKIWPVWRTKCTPCNSRLWQLKRRRALTLEHPVDEHAVLAVAHHVEGWVFVVDLEVPSRDKAGVAHVDVDLTLAAIAADRDAPLPNHVFELAALETCDRGTLGLRIPLHLCRTGRRRLQRQKSPRVALLGTRVRRHSTESE